SLFDYMFTRKPTSKEALRRELLVGCGLEIKEPDLLFFPHRSIQEYLVAENIQAKLRAGAVSVTDFARALSVPEVWDFLQQLVTLRDLDPWLSHLNSFCGQIPFLIEEFLQGQPVYRSRFANITENGYKSPWVGLLYLKQRVIDPDRHHIPQGMQPRVSFRLHESGPWRELVKIGTRHYVYYAIHLLIRTYFPPHSGKLTSYALSELLVELKHMWTTEIREFVRAKEDQSRSQHDTRRGVRRHKLRSKRYHATNKWLRTPAHLKELLTAIAVHAEANVLQLGSLRITLRDFYLDTCSLASMFEKGNLSSQYDFSSSVGVEDKTDLRPLVDLLDSIRQTTY
ncbi:hypothetical protein ACFLQW_04815, partial [Candidatus Zixiibacteriota bacterium]